MKDFILFKTMITPQIVQILFWIFTCIAIVTGLTCLFAKHGHVGVGIATLFLGPLCARVFSELWIVTFRIHESLVDIAQKK